MRTRSTVGSDDRAVSDVVGYVLTFSLITISVGVITVGGFSTLEDRQDAERINNAERAFDVLAANVEDIYRGGAPSRATEMRLSGGSIRYGEQITIKIASGGDNVTAQSIPLIYEQGNTKILYVSGAIIRVDSGKGVMLRSPPFVFKENTIHMPLIETAPRTSNQLGGKSTIQIVGQSAFIDSTPPQAVSEPSGDVNITINSSRTEVWKRYFERQDGTVDSDLENDRVSLIISDKDSIAAPRFRIRLWTRN